MKPVIVKDNYEVPVIPVTFKVVAVGTVQLPVKPTNELHERDVGVRLGARVTSM